MEAAAHMVLPHNLQKDKAIEQIGRMNAKLEAKRIREMYAEKIAQHKILVEPAMYEIETGKVIWFEKEDNHK